MKTTPTPPSSAAQSHDPHATAKLRELIEDISIAMIVTVTPEGALRSRPMMTQESDEAGEL